MERYLFFLVLTLFANKTLSQESTILYKGVVITSISKLPVSYATVVLLNNEGLAIEGTTTEEDGTFEMRGALKGMRVEVSFIGFNTKLISEFRVENGVVDLGTILLEEDSKVLQDVIIEGERSQTVFKLDKRIFNVGKDLSSTGASALEVLNNVPSVEVSIEGAISLRGNSGVQILINGKPSVIASEEGNALGTITADMIESVEVITSPSAKYEAEGSAGIINIILKKEEKKGMNGSISLNTGWPHNHSVGASINYRTEKFNLFSQLGAGYRSIPEVNENINKNHISGESILSNGTEYRNERFYNISLGTDFHLNERNVFTLTGSYAYELEGQPSETGFEKLNRNGDVLSFWTRTEETTAQNPKWQYEFYYKSLLKDNNEDHFFLISAQGDFFGKDLQSDFSNIGSGSDFENVYQQTETNFAESKYIYQIDYKKPFNERFTLESGGQYLLQTVRNDYSVTDLINDEWIVNPGLTNVFSYKQNVLGVYATAAYEGDKWGLKAGLRTEYTDQNTFLETTNEKNDQNYFNLFPSIHTSYKVTNRLSFQVGYSRRIYRPRLWELNPFFNIRNNYNVWVGNPSLKPSFTNYYELNSIYILDKASINVNLFHNYVTDVIDRIRIFEGNTSISKPVNAGINSSIGLDYNAKFTAYKWLTVSSDGYFNYIQKHGVAENMEFDFSTHNYSLGITTQWKLPYDITIEVSGEYFSGMKTIQGYEKENYEIDCGIRKKLMNGKAVISLSVRDVFASDYDIFIAQDKNFYVYSYSNRGRFMTLGFSYGFGKGEAMEYNGRRR